MVDIALDKLAIGQVQRGIAHEDGARRDGNRLDGRVASSGHAQ